MRATRRYWGAAAVGGFLAALAVLLERPALLAGAALVGAWLLAHQYRFYRELSRTAEALDAEQSLPRDRVAVDEDVTLAVSGRLPEPSTLDLTIRPDLPVATVRRTYEEGTARLVPGQREATAVCSVSWPVAGAYELDPPTVAATDGFGLLREEIALGSGTSIAVEPRSPRNVHVGTGGEEIATAYGEHAAGRLGSGLDPAELREYVAGDPSERIDWKATARLAEPYVRTYEAETDRRTALLLDHRETMTTGPDGETKFDYAREVALAFVASARRLDDPIGCYTVGDAGTTNRYLPEATTDQYVHLRSLLQDLRPTRRPDATPAGDVDASPANSADGAGRSEAPRAPADARSASSALDDDSAFAETLRPFFADTRTYVRRTRGDPLFDAARTAIGRLQGTLWTAIFTDDSRRAELRETVKLARRGDDHVLVFVTPTALFEPGGLGDLEAAYERYLDFESFRRELARLPRVHAFEVGPGDRLDAVLAAGRDRRERRAATGGA